MVTLEAAQRRLEEDEGYQKNIECVSEGSEGEVQQNVQNYLAHLLKVSWMNKEQFEHLESGVWRAVEARRKRKDEEQEQRRQAEQGQEQSKQGEHMRFGEEQQLGRTEAENAGELEVMGRMTEVRTGRGRVGLVPGRDESCGLNETSRKGKGKGNGGKGEHEGKGGGFGRKGFQQSVREKGFQQSVRENEEEWGRVAPNMGVGGSHPQATSDPGKEEKEKKETRMLSWADSNDEEAKENEEEVKEEKETGQREMTDERPRGLEEVENEPKTQEEEKYSQVESEQEAQEEESRRTREEQKRAQEAQEEEKRARETRKEESRAQEAREDEERRAREAREEESRAQEAREEQRRAQEAREEEASAQEEQVEAQEGHEGEEAMTTQEKCVEEQKETNSMHEESHVSNTHMTWWQNAWWVRVNGGPHLRTARDRRKVWRAATRAAQEVRETGKVAGREREEWEKRETERRESNTLHIVLHLQPQQHQQQ